MAANRTNPAAASRSRTENPQVGPGFGARRPGRMTHVNVKERSRSADLVKQSADRHR